MNCYKCKKIINKIHNDCINDNELQSVLHHIQECESCNAYYKVMEQMVDDLSSMEAKELPKGFHNRLHFALEREAENPQKSQRRLSTGIKAAAIAACSILLVVAAIGIISPRQKGFDSLINMTQEEALEAPELENDMDTQASEEEYSEESGLFGTGKSRDDVDGQTADECVPEEESDAVCADESLVDGGSIVLIIDVDDIDGTYKNLLEYIPNSLPDTNWLIEDFEEPEEYKQLRIITDIAEAQNIAEEIALEYAYNIEFYSPVFLEYDNYQEETADLQDVGYVLIVIK